MRSPQITFTAAAAATALALAGCGGGGGGGGGGAGASQSGAKTGPQKEAYQATRDLVTASLDRDGKKYCGSLTLDLLEKTTGAQSDAARKRCERQVKAGSRELPLRVAVAPGRARQQGARIAFRARPPQARVRLRREGGKLKVDAVE